MTVVYQSDATADVALTTTSETVIATLAGVTTPRPGMAVRLRGYYRITTGTGTTTVTTRIRRDSIVGTVVGEATPETISAAAGGTEAHDLEITDTVAGEIAGATYVLTAQQAGATGNGTAVNSRLEAEVDR